MINVTIKDETPVTLEAEISEFCAKFLRNFRTYGNMHHMTAYNNLAFIP
jgi:hypothetical protein